MRNALFKRTFPGKALPNFATVPAKANGVEQNLPGAVAVFVDSRLLGTPEVRTQNRAVILSEVWPFFGQTESKDLRLLFARQAYVLKPISTEEQPQILRLTTPKLKYVWGPVRSG